MQVEHEMLFARLDQLEKEFVELKKDIDFLKTVQRVRDWKRGSKKVTT